MLYDMLHSLLYNTTCISSPGLGCGAMGEESQERFLWLMQWAEGRRGCLRPEGTSRQAAETDQRRREERGDNYYEHQRSRRAREKDKQ